MRVTDPRRMHGARTTFVRVFETHVDAPPPARPSGLAAGEFRIVGRPADPRRECEGAPTFTRRGVASMAAVG
jgi:hypothetical protein